MGAARRRVSNCRAREQKVRFADHPIDQDPGAGSELGSERQPRRRPVTAGRRSGRPQACHAPVLQVIVNQKEHRFGVEQSSSSALKPLPIPIPETFVRNGVSAGLQSHVQRRGERRRPRAASEASREPTNPGATCVRWGSWRIRSMRLLGNSHGLYRQSRFFSSRGIGRARRREPRG